MKRIYQIFTFFIFTIGLSIGLYAQQLKISDAINEVFYQQYPYATNIKLSAVNNYIIIDFVMKGKTYCAFYKNNEWKYTVMNFLYDGLPVKIKNEFMYGKFRENNILKTAIIYWPSGIEQYRLTIKNKNDTSRYFFYGKDGRMIRKTHVI